MTKANRAHRFHLVPCPPPPPCRPSVWTPALLFLSLSALSPVRPCRLPPFFHLSRYVLVFASYLTKNHRPIDGTKNTTIRDTKKKALATAALTHNARAAASALSAGLSHQLRDATRRGLWLYPPGGPETPPLGYPVYLLAQALLPLLGAYCLLLLRWWRGGSRSGGGGGRCRRVRRGEAFSRGSKMVGAPPSFASRESALEGCSYIVVFRCCPRVQWRRGASSLHLHPKGVRPVCFRCALHTAV